MIPNLLYVVDLAYMAFNSMLIFTKHTQITNDIGEELIWDQLISCCLLNRLIEL